MLSLQTYILSFQTIIHTLQKKVFFQFINQKRKKEGERERAKNLIQIIRFLLQKQFTSNTYIDNRERYIRVTTTNDQLRQKKKKTNTYRTI